ncbi:uncharacterized protein LOC127788737 [Diospyros lotus]|uniref:uncharacterized protein LOC127788737 n=1 Tax=Diospyros lotus TaxID=55363 RepID=UPI002259BD6C|nr:uncharacterized protein LOC127788737 [Diospyros lotus]
MEGLIPMVFKAFKKNRTRSQYKCLSTSNSTPPPQSYDFSHVYPQGYTYHYATPPPHPASGRVNGRHRRTMSSMGDYSTGSSAPEPEEHRLKSRQLLRLGSHGFLSCVK